MTFPPGTHVSATAEFAREMFETDAPVSGTVEAAEIDPRDGIEYVMVHLDTGKYVLGTSAAEWRIAAARKSA